MAAQFSAFQAGGTGARASRDEIVARLDAIATLLDNAFVIPGTTIRFGLDGIVGLVPGIGDLLSSAMSGYLVYEAHRLGLPRRKLARMLANIAFDTAIGAVPLLGDAADVLFKANRRNMRIIRDHLAGEERRARGVVDADFRVVRPPR